MSTRLYQNYHESEDMLRLAALDYATRGIPVFPLYGMDNQGQCTCGQAGCRNAGKHPDGRLAPHGFKDATTDVQRVKAWWTQAPTANIGTITGAATGRFVVDIDPKDDGWETADRLEEAYGFLPSTITVSTGSGGLHIHLRYPEGLDLRNSAGAIGRGIDIRANGGFVVLPPSLHASGRRYEWTWTVVDDDDPQPEDLASAPVWLLKLLSAPTQAFPQDRSPRPSHIGEAGRGNDQQVFGEGQRNSALASKAGAMRRAGFSEDEILTALEKLNADRCTPPLTESEVQKIARSIARYAPAPALLLRAPRAGRAIRVMNGRVA